MTQDVTQDVTDPGRDCFIVTEQDVTVSTDVTRDVTISIYGKGAAPPWPLARVRYG